MKIKFLQEGGAVGAPAPETGNMPASAPADTTAAQGGGEDPIMMLAQMAAQALQNNDAQMALQVCQGFLQLVQQMAGEAGGEEPISQGEPVYGKGGKLVGRI